MSLEQIKQSFRNSTGTASLVSLLKQEKTPVTIKGLSGSASVFLASCTADQIAATHIFVLSDKEEAAYFYDDLEKLTENDQIYFFPSSYKRSAQYDSTDESGLVMRTKTLDAMEAEKQILVITYPEALIEKVITRSRLKKNTLEIKTGETLSIEFINDMLAEYGFERVDFVYQPGQYSIRGSIVDLFSYSASHPHRIDFFGDEIDSIRTFDTETQLSDKKVQKISVVPNLLELTMEEAHIPFLNFIPDDSVLWIKDTALVIDKMRHIFEATLGHEVQSENGSFEGDKSELLTQPADFAARLKAFRCIETGSASYFKPEQTVRLNTSAQPVFNKNFELLAANLEENSGKGYTLYILSENTKQFDRLREIFEGLGKKINFTPLDSTVNEGFVDHDQKICLYTDHQIFERYHKYRLDTKFTKKESITIKELTGLHPGDYIVHIDHGIGKFGGLEKIEVNGRMQEAIRLVYRDNDILFVSIHSLHRISKYKGKEGSEPRIYKLGTGAWQKLKQNTKKKVKDIAKELIALYAKRRAQKGFGFSPDTYLQQELEASFIYEDTPDQESATRAVKEGMESDYPMDRLVCGDVGFGKTEVAIRAAFKAVTDSKQVAILVPTTVLALQHYQTFKDRLKDFPCTIDYISRLKNGTEQKATINNVKEGTTDIVIGTHRLVGKDIKFKDLGLLIIDEEQKFGVTVKEKLKKLKINVDTLTLTATPIPRTLQFSLMGARDLSIINTPPPNRHPIITELHTFNDEIIKEAIEYEVSRNGQVFFIHNRVQNIEEVRVMIDKLCPGVQTIVAHGQMEGPKLEKIMLDFISGNYDVLIATTIIESGLDIPNANTIIINNAQNFGLSDLHQLRGRVGRSNKKAFCYLLAPPLTSVTPEARRRLKAIEDFSELGSGFNIAMQDLDIRGAGNLLGGEQSGFIADIGFETYHQILNEAVQELRDEEFKDLFEERETTTGTPDSNKPSPRKQKTWVSDCVIDTDLEILFPDEYIYNVSERIKLYRELDNIENEESLQNFAAKLEDRFGKIPAPSLELFNVVRVRWLAMKLGFEKIILKNGKLLVYFVSNQQSPYYQSSIFAGIMKYLQQHPRQFSMKEAKGKLYMSVNDIKNLEQTIGLFRKITDELEK